MAKKKRAEPLPLSSFAEKIASRKAEIDVRLAGLREQRDAVKIELLENRIDILMLHCKALGEIIEGYLNGRR